MQTPFLSYSPRQHFHNSENISALGAREQRDPSPAMVLSSPNPSSMRLTASVSRLFSDSNISQAADQMTLPAYAASALMEHIPPEEWDVNQVDLTKLDIMPKQFRVSTLAQVVMVQLSDVGLGMNVESLNQFTDALNEVDSGDLEPQRFYNTRVFNGVPLAVHVLQRRYLAQARSLTAEALSSINQAQPQQGDSLLTVAMRGLDKERHGLVARTEESPLFLGFLTPSVTDGELKVIRGKANLNQRLANGRNIIDEVLARRQFYDRLPTLLNGPTRPGYAHLSLQKLENLKGILETYALHLPALAGVRALLETRSAALTNEEAVQRLEQLQNLFETTDAFPNEDQEVGESVQPSQAVRERAQNLIDQAKKPFLTNCAKPVQLESHDAFVYTTMEPLLKKLLFHRDLQNLAPATGNWGVAKFLGDNVDTLETLVPNLRQMQVKFQDHPRSVHWILDRCDKEQACAEYVIAYHHWLHNIDPEQDINNEHFFATVDELLYDTMNGYADRSQADIYTDAIVQVAGVYRETLEVAAIDVQGMSQKKLFKSADKIRTLEKQLQAQVATGEDDLEDTFINLRDQLKNTVLQSGQHQLQWARTLPEALSAQGVEPNLSIKQAIQNNIDTLESIGMLPVGIFQDQDRYAQTLHNSVTALQGRPLSNEQRQAIQQRASSIAIVNQFQPEVPRQTLIALLEGNQNSEEFFADSVSDLSTLSDKIQPTNSSQGASTSQAQLTNTDEDASSEPIAQDDSAGEWSYDPGADFKYLLDLFKLKDPIPASKSPEPSLSGLNELKPSQGSASTSPQPADASTYLPRLAETVIKRHQPRLFNLISPGGSNGAGSEIRPQLLQAVYVEGKMQHALGFRPIQVGEKSLLEKPMHTAKRIGHTVRRADTSWRPGKVVSFTPAPPSTMRDKPRGANDTEYLEGAMADSTLGVEVPLSSGQWQSYFSAINTLLPQKHTMDVAPFQQLGQVQHDAAMESHMLLGIRANYTRDYEPSYKDPDFGRAVLIGSGVGDAKRWLPRVENIINNQVAIAKKGLDTTQVDASLKSGFRNKTTTLYQILTLMQQSENDYGLPLHHISAEDRKTLIQSFKYWKDLVEPSALECTKRRLSNKRFSVAPAARAEHFNQLDRDLVKLSSEMAFSGKDLRSFTQINQGVMTEFQEAGNIEIPNLPVDLPSEIREQVGQLQIALVKLANFNCGTFKQAVTDATVNVNRLVQGELNYIYGKQALAQTLEQYGVSGAATSAAISLVAIAIAIEPIGVGTATAAGAAVMRLADVWNNWRRDQSPIEAKAAMANQLRHNTLSGAILPAYIGSCLDLLHPTPLMQSLKGELDIHKLHGSQQAKKLDQFGQDLEQAYQDCFEPLINLIQQDQVHTRLGEEALTDLLVKLTNAQGNYAIAVTNLVNDATARDWMRPATGAKLLAAIVVRLDIPPALQSPKKLTKVLKAERWSLVALNSGDGLPRFKPKRWFSQNPTRLCQPNRYKVDFSLRQNSDLWKAMCEHLNFTVLGNAGTSDHVTRLWTNSTEKEYELHKTMVRSLPALATQQLSPVENPAVALQDPDFFQKRMTISEANPIPEVAKFTFSGRK